MERHLRLLLTFVATLAACRVPAPPVDRELSTVKEPALVSHDGGRSSVDASAAGLSVKEVVDRKILVLATGVVGAGKTTYLRALSKIIMNSVYVEKDIIADAFRGDEDYNSDFYKRHIRDQSYNLMLKIAEQNLMQNRVVLMDSYFGNKLFSPMLAPYITPKMYSERGVETRILYFICNDGKKNHDRILKRGTIDRDSDKLDPEKFAAYRERELKIHAEEFAKLNLEENRHIRLLTVVTDDESADAVAANLRTIVAFLKS